MTMPEAENEEQDDKPEKKDKPAFSDAQLAYIGTVIRKERRRHEAELADLREEMESADDAKDPRLFDQDKEPTRGAESEALQQLRRDLSEERAAREQERVMASATEAALEAGVDPKRARRFLRLADLDGVKSSDSDGIADAIADAAKENPEFVVKADSEKKDPGKDRAKDSARDDSNGRPPTSESETRPGIDRMRAAYATSESSS